MTLDFEKITFERKMLEHRRSKLGRKSRELEQEQRDLEETSDQTEPMGTRPLGDLPGEEARAHPADDRRERSRRSSREHTKEARLRKIEREKRGIEKEQRELEQQRTQLDQQWTQLEQRRGTPPGKVRIPRANNP